MRGIRKLLCCCKYERLFGPLSRKSCEKCCCVIRVYYPRSLLPVLLEQRRGPSKNGGATIDALLQLVRCREKTTGHGMLL
jgi:hypothetical protein